MLQWDYEPIRPSGCQPTALVAATAPSGRWAPSSPHAVLAEPGQALTPWPGVFTWDGGVGPLHCVALAQLSTQVHPLAQAASATPGEVAIALLVLPHAGDTDLANVVVQA